MDLHHELENAIGHGPALPTPADRVASGRRALRRRRAVVATGAAAAVAAVVLPVVAFSGTSPTSGRELAPAAPPAASTSASPAPDRSSRPDRDPAPRFDRSRGEAAYVDVLSGELVVDPDAVVLRRVDDLYPGKDTESVALDLRAHGERTWIALEWDEGGSSGTYGGPDDPFYTGWEDFLAKATSGGGMTSGPVRGGSGGGGSGGGSDGGSGGGSQQSPEPGEVVGLAWDGGRLVASGDTEILEQRSGVDLGPGFAAENDTTGAALVQMAGERQLVLYRGTEGDEGQLVAVLSAGHGASLDALLAWARDRYESGEGLL